MKVKYGQDKTRPWAFMTWLDIPSKVDPTDVYLRRLRIINTPWISVYLHWICESDNDRWPHDHPWNFWSLILRGGYVEEVTDFFAEYPRVCLRRRWSYHRMRVTQAHKIVAIQPRTLSLVITGKRVRTWGFWTDKGFVPIDSYYQTMEDKNENP